ncbi:MAG: MATE family efflux transporter, partial [bacterium]
MATTTLTFREEQRRNFIQNGDLWKVVLFITIPLAVYALFNYLYGFFDIFLVSRYIGTDQVASVMFIDDIKGTIMAIGGGIAAGGTVFIARHYGGGDYEEARRHAGATLVLAVGLSLTIAFLAMGFARPLLRLLAAPETLITDGFGYYLLQMASTVLIAFNAVYMGMERAKGNTKMILMLNIAAMIVKIGLSALFVLALGLGTTFVALATLLAQGMLSVLAFFFLFGRHNSIGIRLADLTIRKQYALPILL